MPNKKQVTGESPGRHLRKLLSIAREALPLENREAIDMESFRIQRTSRGRIPLDRQVRPLDPVETKARRGPGAGELETLSRIIEVLNERFGLNLGSEHPVTLEQIRSALDRDAGLDASARVNTRENVRLGGQDAGKYVATRFASQ